MFDKYQYILWDFDGVIINSDQIRILGFTNTLKEYPKEQVDELISFHKANGGLSRYVKFRYFYEKIRMESVTEDQINLLAKRFTEIMQIHLPNKELLIDDSVNFIKSQQQNFEMHVVSGSDQKELNSLCLSLGLSDYFLSITGSPTPKNELVKKLLSSKKITAQSSCLIGDSINDYEAAAVNEIDFYGYNNLALKGLGQDYIFSFEV